MNCCLRSLLFALLLAAGWVACLEISAVAAVADDEIRPATDRPQPKSPEESAKCVKLSPGFRLELVAAEPLVRESTAMCFDERGRLFVCEIHGYNLDGYIDIVELNKTGKLDREVRRVRHATPESQAAAKLETYGTVRMLTDADGDGRMDKSVVWADRLPPCYGVIASRGGVIVVCAPDIVFLADRDGDGTAEVRETLFTGFARELIERGMSNPRWGPDNWIYVAAGGGGGEITGPKLATPVSIGHTDFRIKPDGSAIEPVTGTEHIFGLTMTDFGDRFHTILSQVVPLPHRYLARNPYVPSPPGDLALNPYREIFPISQPDPWRLARGSDPEWVKFYGPTETQPNGFFTASSGQLIYRADAFPPEFHGNYFICDPANNLVHRCILERDGLTYTGRRAPGEERSEFVASTDQWFRPMNLSIGPDGAIYIVDMYREIVEDFSAIPRFLQQQYAESLIAGNDHGRIWRIVPVSPFAPRKQRLFRGAKGDTDQLVSHLSDSNAWWRETAQRLLLERGDKAARQPLTVPLTLGESPAMQRAWDAAGKISLDIDQPLPARLNATSVLSAAPWPRVEPLRELLDARQPTELQLTVVAALTCSDDPAVAESLLANWTGLSPKTQESITDALFARQDRLPKLLDAVEQGVVSPNSLSALRREQLIEHSTESIRTRARKLLAGRTSDDRAAVIRRFESALTFPRNSSRGAIVFEKTCSRCHKLGGKGFEVGPDLAAARTRADATLLLDILDPSGTLSHGFTVYTVATSDGRVHTGLLAGDSATSITLRNAAETNKSAPTGKSAIIESTILRRDIETMQASSKSLMRDGMEKELQPQDIANLIGFLRQSLGKAVPSGVVLFDDEQTFLDALTDGDAVASLSTADKHSGAAALHLTTGQRHSPSIAGWQFRIVEKPAAAKPGEPEQFRYLRFAWKSAGATGLMFEFADNGHWPPADKPVRRYYSGKNNMPWKATELSPDAPADWTVVTVDLWKDFGDFSLKGIAPTAMGGRALFDRIEVLRTLDAVEQAVQRQ